MREWLRENREGLRLHRHLTEAAQAWQKLNHESGELYRGARLAQALEWVKNNAGELNPLEREFFNASKEMREREEAEHDAQRQREVIAAQKLAEAERRRATILRWVAIGSSLLLVVMIGLAVFAFSQRDVAENERRIAFARELSVNSVNNLTVDPERSILLALQAIASSSADGKPVLREAEEALHRAVQASRLQLTLRGHTGGLNDVAFSPDGKRLATASNDKSAKVWGAASGQELFTLCCHADVVYKIAFSPDGKRFATASGDKTVKTWDAATGKELLAFSVAAVGVAFSPDGTARVWDVSTANARSEQPLTLYNPNGAIVTGVAFSPDGKRLAASSNDGTARIYALPIEDILALAPGFFDNLGLGQVFEPRERDIGDILTRP